MALTTQAYSSGPGLIASQLDAYRQRIRQQRRLRYMAFAFVGVCAIWTMYALLAYLNEEQAPSGLLPLSLLLTLALPLAALALEAIRRPSDVETARLLDGLLDNQQRFITAVELLSEQRQGVMPQAQLGSTANLLARIDPKSLYPVRVPWPTMLLGLGLLLMALSIGLLKSGGPSFNAIQAGQLPPEQSAGGVVLSPTPASGLPQSEITPTQDTAASQPTAESDSTPSTGQGSTNPADAANQAASSQQAQADLDKLGKALDGQSATQGAADSLRQGKYGDAAQQLSELGDQNDQLSNNAKQGLADALDQAANDTQTESGLKDAEQKAANALRNGDYKQIAQALKDLGSALQQAAGDVVPQQQLAQNFPANPDQSSQNGQSQDGQGQQSQQSQSNSQGQGQNEQQGSSSAGGQQQGQQGDQGQQSGQGQQSQSGSNNDPGNQQSQGIAPGEGHRVTGPVDPSRPNVKSNPFELDGQNNPSDARPTDKNNNPPLTLQGTGSTGVPSSPGAGNTMNVPGESNSLPVDRWSVIQRYFGHGGK